MCFVNENSKELSWALIQLGSVQWLQRHTLDLHWCNRRKMLAPDSLFLIKQAETVKPLRNTSGFTNVCIFICRCWNVKEAHKICNLCSWEESREKPALVGKSSEILKDGQDKRNTFEVIFLIWTSQQVWRDVQLRLLLLFFFFLCCWPRLMFYLFHYLFSGLTLMGKTRFVTKLTSIGLKKKG